MSVATKRTPRMTPATDGSPEPSSFVSLVRYSLYIPRLIWALFISYLHLLTEMLSIFTPRFWRRQVITEIRAHRRLYHTAFLGSDQPNLDVFLHGIRLIRVYVLSGTRFKIFNLFLMMLLFSTSFSYFFANSSSLAEHFVISDSLLVSKVKGSSLLALFLVISPVIIIFSGGVARKAMIFCTILFVTWFPVLAYFDYIQLISHNVPISPLKFANAIILGSLILGVSFGSYVIILGISFEALDRLREKYVARRHPDATVFAIMLTLLAECNADIRTWTDFSFKRRAINNLNRAANIIENDIVKKLVSSTAASSSIVKDQFHKIAGGLWNKILWITTPQDNTRHEFILRLRQFLMDFALGRWDALEKQDVIIDRRHSWIRRILSASRWCFLAFAPLVLLFLYENLVEPLSAPLKDYARPFVLGWLMVNLISLDPNWKEKLSGVKDLISLKGKNKE
jgi:hypothetical protein